MKAKTIQAKTIGHTPDTLTLDSTGKATVPLKPNTSFALNADQRQGKFTAVSSPSYEKLGPDTFRAPRAGSYTPRDIHTINYRPR